MALVPDQKFSTFQNGGDLEVGDIVVGLRAGLNTKFNYTGELPPGVVIPISNGGTGATTAVQARVNLGLGTIATQDANAVAITGGTISGVAITSSTAALTSGSVVAAPSAGIDIANKTYVDSMVSGAVTSAQGTENKVLINVLTTPQIGALLFTLPQDIAISSSPTFFDLTLSNGFIFDENGNKSFQFTTATSAVNWIGAVAQSTGATPGLTALGTDTNVNFGFTTKGTGFYRFNAANATPIQFESGTGSQHVTKFTFADTLQTRTATFQDSNGTVAWLTDIPTGTPSALTKVDDTNVTLTLGGTPSTALLQATSLTVGWTGQLGLTRGGTAASLTASNGGIVYSTASALAILAGTVTSGQIIRSGSSAAPSWSTTTYPATNAINTIMYASSANVLGSIAAANSSVLLTSSSGVPAMSGAMTNGQLIIGSTGATPAVATLTAGANISITNGAGTITITATGLAGFSWTTITGTSQTMASNNGYIANNAGLVTLTLPASSAVGDELDIIGKGAGGWKVQCGGGQTVVLGSSTTTSGGSVASTQAKDSLYMICTVANTEWTIASAPQSAGLTIA